MFCQHCGTLLPPGAQFCPGCGKAVQASADEAVYRGNAREFPREPAEPSPVAVGEQVRPWVRYWARTTDIIVFSFPMGMVLGVVWPDLMAGDNPASEWVLGFVLLLCWAFVEPLCLSVFHTTPGKALFRIRLLHRGGSEIAYGDALARSLKVWLRGMAMGLPLVSLVTLIVAHGRLKRHGRTSWDAEGMFQVVHQPVGWARTLAAVALFLAFLFVVGAAG